MSENRTPVPVDTSPRPVQGMHARLDAEDGSILIIGRNVNQQLVLEIQTPVGKLARIAIPQDDIAELARVIQSY